MNALHADRAFTQGWPSRRPSAAARMAGEAMVGNDRPAARPSFTGRRFAAAQTIYEQPYRATPTEAPAHSPRRRAAGTKKGAECSFAFGAFAWLNRGRVPVQDPVEQEHVPRLPAGRVPMPPPVFRRAPLPGPARLFPPPMRANGRRLMEAREWLSHIISPSPHPHSAFLGARISGGARKSPGGAFGRDAGDNASFTDRNQPLAP